MKKVNSILIVGGGTAGLIAAIILKKRLNIEVDIVHSKNIGIIGVGEGSTEHWKEFMDFAGINHYDIIKECDATYKCGIMFENWTDNNFLHSVSAPYNNKIGQYKHVYGKLISERNKLLNPKTFWHNQIDKWYLNKPEALTANQFHFNTHKLNEFLIRHAISMGIKVIDDEIENVILSDDGSINYIQGINQYTYDFYIDSTGFKRVLMSSLGARWISYSKYLKMNSAVVFPTEDENEYNFWTLARAMDSGWMFRIPVWGRYGNGYIYNSDITTEDKIKEEIDLYFKKDIEIKKHFKFDPGALDKVWIKNCVAIGLSGSFVEPLEASSIGTSIQQTFLLMHKINLYDQKVIDNYNDSFKDIMNNILDFIFLHYKTEKKNNDFWIDVSNLEEPNDLKYKLEMWKTKLPINEDFKNLSDYILFKEDNFIMIMEGLNLFNLNSIKTEYESLQHLLKRNADETVGKQKYLENNMQTLSHKQFIRLTRENL